MSKAPEDAVRSQFASLKEAAAQSAVELQKNVHKNYTEFVKTSKAISVMETDMLTVRAMLNELRAVGQELLEARAEGDELEEALTGGKEALDADGKEEQLLRQQRKLEMAKVLGEVEGAQGILDGAERYFVAEGDLVELDPDDYHSAKVVHITLFNDGIMVSSVRKASRANKRKSSIIQPNRLVAEKFLPLKDLAVVNVRDSEELRNAFKLMRHPITYLFKATGKEDKLKWTSVIKETIDTQMKVGPGTSAGASAAPSSAKSAADSLMPFAKGSGDVESSDSEDEGKGPSSSMSRGRRKLSAFFASDNDKKKKAAAAAAQQKAREAAAPAPSGTTLRARKSILEKAHAKEQVGEKAGKDAAERPQDTVLVDQATVRELSELAEDLDVFIAQRQFDTAVAQVERITPLLASLPPQSNEYHVQKKLVDSQVIKLADSIGQDLRNPLSTKHQVKENIARLMRLGLLDQAREIFLATQTVIIKHKIKKLRFEGEIYSYIRKLSQVVFFLLKNTCIWYKGFFQDPSLSSGFVRWITREIEDYCSIFRRHVFQNQNFQTTIDCLRVAAENCSSVKQ